MAIENLKTKTVVYQGNGSTTAFDICFDYANESEILPCLYDLANNNLSLIPKAEYAVDTTNQKVFYPDLTGLEGSSVKPDPLQKGQYLIILRKTELSQREASADKSFTSQDVERALDKLTRITQELAECCTRSIKFNPAEVQEFEGNEFDSNLLDAKHYIDFLTALKNKAAELSSRAEQAVEDAEQKIKEANTTLDTAQKEVEIAKEKAAIAEQEAKKAVDANAEAQKALTETKVLAGDVKTGLASKQDKLTAGKNIKIEGRVISAEVPESAFGVDGTTIKRNASNTISTVAVKDEHKGTVMGFWQGTLAEYNAIKDRLPATTIAHITDDAEVHLNLTEHDFVTNAVLESSLATKQPVGDYATNDALTAGLDSKQPVGDYVDAGEITDLIKAQIPTGVSAFVNDAGYLTESPDVSIYATKESVPVTVEEVLSTKDYALRTEVPSLTEMPTKLSQLANDVGYITNDEVNVDSKLSSLKAELTEQIEENASAILTKQNILTNGTGIKIEDDTISAYIANETRFGVVKLIYTEETGTLNIVTEY